MKGHERPAQAPRRPPHTQACDETQGAEGTWRQRTHLLSFRRQEVSREGESSRWPGHTGGDAGTGGSLHKVTAQGQYPCRMEEVRKGHDRQAEWPQDVYAAGLMLQRIPPTVANAGQQRATKWSGRAGGRRRKRQIAAASSKEVVSEKSGKTASTSALKEAEAKWAAGAGAG